MISENMPYLPFILMPFIVAGVGWLTNWLGIKMLLQPTKWKGIGFVGWQGIIPRIRVRFTRDIIQKAVSNICSPSDMIGAINETDAITHISKIIAPQLEDVIDEFMLESGAKYWQMAPRAIRAPLYRKVLEELPVLSRGLLDDVKQRADYLIDIEDLAVGKADKNPAILTDLVMSMFRKEFSFIIFSGLYIGFPLGCLQAVLWYFSPSDILLPIFGAFVGGGTNWIALQVLAYPVKPIKVLGFTIQGIVIKRQEHVAKHFALNFTTKFLAARDIFDHVWYGKHRDEVQRMVKKQLRHSMDASLITKGFDTALRLASQNQDYDDKALAIVENNLVHMLDRDMVSEQILRPVQDLIQKRMSEMSPHQFQELFLPIFNQDKWLLVGVGAILGGAVGFLQLVYLFGNTVASL